MYTCDECGYQTDRLHNLKRHEETHDDNEDETESDSTDQSFIESDSDTDASEEDTDALDLVMVGTFEALKDEFENLVEEYEREGKEKDEAEALAKQTLLPKYREEAIEKYLTMIRWQRSMASDPIHKKVKATAKRLRDEEEYDPYESWQYALEKRKFLLDEKIKRFKLTEEDSD